MFGPKHCAKTEADDCSNYSNWNRLKDQTWNMEQMFCAGRWEPCWNISVLSDGLDSVVGVKLQDVGQHGHDEHEEEL